MSAFRWTPQKIWTTSSEHLRLGKYHMSTKVGCPIIYTDTINYLWWLEIDKYSKEWVAMHFYNTIYSKNKKVLLRERNRHTARRVESTPSVVLSGTGKDMGPVEVLWDGDGAPCWKWHGTSGSIMGWRWGTPQVCTNKQTESITFPHPSNASSKMIHPHCMKARSRLTGRRNLGVKLHGRRAPRITLLFMENKCWFSHAKDKAMTLKKFSP